MRGFAGPQTTLLRDILRTVVSGSVPSNLDRPNRRGIYPVNLESPRLYKCWSRRLGSESSNDMPMTTGVVLHDVRGGHPSLSWSICRGDVAVNISSVYLLQSVYLLSFMLGKGHNSILFKPLIAPTPPTSSSCPLLDHVHYYDNHHHRFCR